MRNSSHVHIACLPNYSMKNTFFKVNVSGHQSIMCTAAFRGLKRKLNQLSYFIYKGTCCAKIIFIKNLIFQKACLAVSLSCYTKMISKFYYLLPSTMCTITVLRNNKGDLRRIQKYCICLQDPTLYSNAEVKCTSYSTYINCWAHCICYVFVD